MKIRGNTVGTTMKRPDFNNPNSILNNPIPPITEADEGKIVVIREGAYTLESANTIVTASVTAALNTEVDV